MLNSDDMLMSFSTPSSPSKTRDRSPALIFAYVVSVSVYALIFIFFGVAFISPLAKTMFPMNPSTFSIFFISVFRSMVVRTEALG